jgi:hypothetical protein
LADNDIITYDGTSGTARDVLRNDTRPFSGMQICCTGVKDKIALFGKARELGATCSNDFTDLTTHLVADSPGSAKYLVSFSSVLGSVAVLIRLVVCS